MSRVEFQTREEAMVEINAQIFSHTVLEGKITFQSDTKCVLHTNAGEYNVEIETSPGEHRDDIAPQRDWDELDEDLALANEYM